MREREPNRAELEKAGCFGIEDAAGDVDVGDRVAVKKHIAKLEVEEKRQYGNAGGEPEEKLSFGVPGGGLR
jgi:hypothetical protein